MAQKSVDEFIKNAGLWSQLKRFLLFQVKLYLDATRDLFLSFFAIFAFIADLVFQLQGADSLFEKLLGVGRRTERAINLFNQYDTDEQGKNSVDGLFREVEDRLRNPPE